MNMPPRKSTSNAGAPVMDDKKLIDLVRTHECLYNMHSRQYKDDIMKTNCWSKIADELGVSMSCPDPGEYFDVMKC